MSREENETPELNAIAAALSSLTPSTLGLDRDRLMFLAGETSALSHREVSHLPARRWAWPTAFSTMSAVAATLLAMLWVRPDPQVVEQIVHGPSEPQTTAEIGSTVDCLDMSEHLEPARPALDRRPADDDYLRLRGRVLALGLDSWNSGRSTSGASPADTPHNQRELMESVLKSL